MRRINTGLMILIGVAAGGLALSAAQSGNTVDTVRVLQELVSEVRQLRIAVEQSSQVQAQAQVFGSQLTLQQRRISDFAARVDTARRELDGLTARSRGIVNELGNLANLLPQLDDPQKRREAEQHQQFLKQELERNLDQEQQVRNREAEVAQALALEETKLNDLMARVDQSFKK